MAELSEEQIIAISNQSSQIVGEILTLAKSPAQAFYILTLAIWRINFELVDKPATLDGLISDITNILNSIRREYKQ